MESGIFDSLLFLIEPGLQKFLAALLFVLLKYITRYCPFMPATKISSFTKAIVIAVRNKIADSRYSKSNIVTEFPSLNFAVNCSGFINHVLEAQCPDALQEVKDFITATEDIGFSNVTPLCLYYYRFLQRKQNKKFWETPNGGRNLQPGDLFIFCEDIERVTKSGQHIMMIAGTQQAIDCTWISYPIYDSTGYGHGENDPRGKGGITGVGEGNIAVQCDADGAILALKWSPTSTKLMNPKIAIGRVKY